MAAGTKVLIAAPAGVPKGLAEALRVCLARNDEALAARLALLSVAGREPRLTLALTLAPVSKTVLEAIVRDISAAVQGALEGEPLDIMVAGADGLSARIAETAPLVYERA